MIAWRTQDDSYVNMGKPGGNAYPIQRILGGCGAFQSSGKILLCLPALPPVGTFAPEFWRCRYVPGLLEPSQKQVEQLAASFKCHLGPRRGSKIFPSKDGASFQRQGKSERLFSLTLLWNVVGRVAGSCRLTEPLPRNTEV